MTLLELFEAVNDTTLDKWKLEEYHDALSDLKSKMHVEMAEILQRKALYEGSQGDRKQTEIKREWNSSKDGLRELQLREYIKATSVKLSSLKNRLYSTY